MMILIKCWIPTVSLDSGDLQVL